MDDRDQDLRDGVRALIGLECWGAVAGDGTALSLYFGRKFPKDRPTPNVHLTPVVRENEAEFSLFMRGTPWRVQTATVALGPLVGLVLGLALAAGAVFLLPRPERDGRQRMLIVRRPNRGNANGRRGEQAGDEPTVVETRPCDADVDHER